MSLYVSQKISPYATYVRVPGTLCIYTEDFYDLTPAAGVPFAIVLNECCDSYTRRINRRKQHSDVLQKLRTSKSRNRFQDKDCHHVKIDGVLNPSSSLVFFRNCEWDRADWLDDEYPNWYPKPWPWKGSFNLTTPVISRKCSGANYDMYPMAYGEGVPFYVTSTPYGRPKVFNLGSCVYEFNTVEQGCILYSGQYVYAEQVLNWTDKSTIEGTPVKYGPDVMKRWNEEHQEYDAVVPSGVISEATTFLYADSIEKWNYLIKKYCCGYPDLVEQLMIHDPPTVANNIRYFGKQGISGVDIDTKYFSYRDSKHKYVANRYWTLKLTQMSSSGSVMLLNFEGVLVKALPYKNSTTQEYLIEKAYSEEWGEEWTWDYYVHSCYLPPYVSSLIPEKWKKLDVKLEDLRNTAQDLVSQVESVYNMPRSFFLHSEDYAKLRRLALENLRYVTVNSLAFMRDLINIRDNLVVVKDIIRKPHNPKTWANLWLSYRYGITLFIKDCVSLRNSIEKILEDLDDFGRVRSRMVKRSLIDGRAYDVELHLKVYYRIESRERKTMLWLLQWLRRLDLYPSFENVWDLIPYSFVVDWLIPFGDALGQIDLTIDSFLFPVVSVLYSYKARSNVLRLDASSVDSSNVVVTDYERWIEETLPLTQVTLGTGHMSIVRWADAVALVVQRLK